MSTRLLVEKNVPIPMRDGIVLKADICRPDADKPVPAILARTPYSKDMNVGNTAWFNFVNPAANGYAVVFQDTRGRFQSEGDFYPHFSEGRDGYDTVEWLAAQPWCSGQVGMTGVSYLGMAQWLAAVEQPPHLQAICPLIAPSGCGEGPNYQGGAFQLGAALWWTLGVSPPTAMRLAQAGRGDPRAAQRLLSALDRLERLYWHLPLASLSEELQSETVRFYFEFMSHDQHDVFWEPVAFNRHYGRVLAPAYNVSGWYDCFLGGTLENFVRMRQEGGSKIARSGQRLLVGPWPHAGQLHGEYPEVSFGLSAGVPLTDLQLRFFDHHLKGEDNGLDDEPPVRFFVMGENAWRDEHEWPLARTQYTAWYLHSDGNARSAGGTLSPHPPGQEAQDLYLYDPSDPCPTLGGPTLLPGFGVRANAGPKDQRPSEARPDVLVYTSDPLDAPLEVTGPLTCTLYAATSAPDTDWVVRLCDVHPDGASRILAEGILRARYREGTKEAKFIEPGRVYAYQIDLVATSNVFLPGHRIRVDVTSSSFPRFDRNPNTGHPLGQDGPHDLRPALQTIYHDGERPSHITLPVIPR
jgi:putative CocE/NonD family hydrolase